MQKTIILDSLLHMTFGQILFCPPPPLFFPLLLSLFFLFWVICFGGGGGVGNNLFFDRESLQHVGQKSDVNMNGVALLLNKLCIFLEDIRSQKVEASLIV